MSFEETVNYNIRYTIEGVDQSVRSTQRLLYFTNAVRLSIVDLQQVIAGPTISNILWTTIQLTRAWTHLHRIIKATNQEQRISMAQGLVGRGIGGRGIGRGLGGGQITLAEAWGQAAPSTSLLQQFLNMGELVTPIGAIPLTGLTLGIIGAGIGYIAYRRRQINMYKDWRQRQRDIAKAQGLEY